MTTPPRRILIEVAVSTLKDAQTALAAGADRLELSTALEVGGLTPSLGAFLTLREHVCLPIIVLLRPRPGGFVYDDGEFQTLHRDAETFLHHGADGLAFGFLTPDRQVDTARTAQFARLAAGRQTVFHRAFDLTPNPFTALETLIDLNITRILTSGQQPSAPEGAPLLRQLIHRAANRIEILPAAGITPANAPTLLAQTTATQLHGTFSTPTTDPAPPIDPGHYRLTSGAQVTILRKLL